MKNGKPPMRNYDKETEWDAKKYKRLTFKVDRKEYEQLSKEQQKTLSQKIRDLIREFLKPSEKAEQGE